MDYYNFERLTNDINKLVDQYPFIQKSVQARSVQGRSLYVLRIGQGEDEILFLGAQHSQDWITSALLIRYIMDYAVHYIKGTRLAGYNMRSVFNASSVYIMPMVNPDGVELASSGLKAYQNWQANARGVDLDCNYDALWDIGKSVKQSYGIFGPGASKYWGKKPESEPETVAVTNLVRSHRFKQALDFCTYGEKIIYSFEGKKHYEFAKILSSICKYSLLGLEVSIGYGSFCDWFCKEVKRPAYKILVGKERTSLTSDFEEIYKNLLELFIISSII